MPRRAPALPEESGPEEAKTGRRTARLLIVSPVRAERDAIAASLAGRQAACACDGPTASALLHQGTYDVALVGLGGSAREGLALVPELIKAQASISCIVIAEQVDLELATAVMRAGGVDVLPACAGGAAMELSLATAIRRSRTIRAREIKMRRRSWRLRAEARELHKSRQELMNQFGAVCSGMSAGYRDLSEQIRHVSMAAELNAILRQELDLESLLRTVLEYVLKRIGSTNAAIFLPSTSGDFTLGAYVNYDCPKDSAETLLDHMADVIAPAFEADDGEIRIMRGLGGLTDQTFGPGVDWLEDSTIAAFSCRQDDECLGVVVLFRDRRNPFSPSTVHDLKIIRELFAKQLSRVIRVHHRHLPKDQWGGFGIDGDDVDLAA